MRTLGYALVTPKKVHTKVFYPRKVNAKFQTLKIVLGSQISTPKIGLRSSPSLFCLRTHPLTPPNPRPLGERDVYPVETKGK